MTSPKSRSRITSIQTWNEFVAGVVSRGENVNPYDLRKVCYAEIETVRNRPLLVYAAKFPGAPAGSPISIDVTDVDGFTDLVHSVEGRSVDILLHSPGGSPEATERIVSIIRSQFDDVTFLIPHSAYSAATMLALSGNSIILHPSATLGPIDPQINGNPARSIRRGFDKIRDLLKAEGPEALPAYLPLIEKHSIELLEICDDFLKLSKELATEWLSKYMFGARKDPATGDVIGKAVDFFSDYDEHKTHSRPLMLEKIQPLGLAVERAEGDLQELLWEAHILLDGFFNMTSFVKLFENGHGLSWGRQVQIISLPSPEASLPQQPLP